MKYVLFTITVQTSTNEGCAQGKHITHVDYNFITICYLVKHIDNYFGERNIDDLNKAR